MRMSSIWNMLQKVDGLRGTKDISAWEDKFIGSCIEACGHDKCTSRLSSAQVEKIQEIHEKHFA